MKERIIKNKKKKEKLERNDGFLLWRQTGLIAFKLNDYYILKAARENFLIFF